MAKRESKAEEGRLAIKKLAETGAFSSLSGNGRDRQECMIHVYWSGLNYPDGDKRGHLVQRGKVTADLGLETMPMPPFTDEEMQSITFAAKMQALRCIRARKRAPKR